MNATIKTYLSTNTLLSLYYALAYPILTYGVLLWGSSSQRNIKSLFIQQKKAVRIVTKSAYLEHTNPLFSQLNLLKLNNIYQLFLGSFMHKVINGDFPGGVDINTNLNASYHGYSTRQLKN